MNPEEVSTIAPISIETSATRPTPIETTRPPNSIEEAPVSTATTEASQLAAASAEPTAPTTTIPEETQTSPEPQNPLTERFTTQEWIVLKEFRVTQTHSQLYTSPLTVIQDALPEILAQAFPDDPKAKETPFSMWGVKIDPNNPRDAKVSVVLMKFLRAR